LEGRCVPTTITPTTFADGGLGSGSLRDAVLQFNADTGTDDDIIQLQAGTYALTIQNVGGRHDTAGLTGDLNLTSTSHRWIIQGAGPTIIDASRLQDRAFQIVNPGTQVVFQDLVIQGGLAQDNGADGAQAGTTDALGGGIFNNGGDVTLENVVLQNNGAHPGDQAVRRATGYSARGAGIYSTGGALTLAGATIANNQATGGRGGASSLTYYLAGNGGPSSGAGLYASGGSLDISDSRIANNQATGGRGGDGALYYTTAPTSSGGVTYVSHRLGGRGGAAQGGGLYVNGGSLTVASSIIASNQGTGGPDGVNGPGGGGVSDGGGLYVFSNAATPTVSNSTLSGNSANRYGGGIYNDLHGTLTVSNSTLSGSSANEGGGISNEGTLTVSDSTLSGNSATGTYGEGGGGGIYNWNRGTLTVNDSILSSNSSTGRDGGGGGIFNEFGTLTVNDSTLSSNAATSGGAYAGGGAINNYGGTLTVSNSTLTGNSVTADGGGIYNQGTLTVSSCTLAGNSANGSGGGIYNHYQGTLTISNSTLAGNRTGFYGGGLSVLFGSLPSLRNTLIAENFFGAQLSDVDGRLNPAGAYNLIGDGTGMTGLTNGVNGNQVGSASAPIDPLLGPLQGNGGPTQTMALLPGSPAIDAGDNADAPDWDQRGPGYPRIVNGIIDIGAFEVQAPAAGRTTWPPLAAPVAVRALGAPGGPLLGQPPDLLAAPSPLPGPGIPDGQTVQPEPVPVPTAAEQPAPAAWLDTYPGTEQPVPSLDSLSASALDALALNTLGGP
jgi:hypothetical protein